MRSIISRCKIAKNLSTNRLLLLSWSNYDLFHTSVMNRKRVECLWRASNVLELIGTYESTFLGWQEFASRTSKIYCDSLFVGLKILVHVCFFLLWVYQLYFRRMSLQRKFVFANWNLAFPGQSKIEVVTLGWVITSFFYCEHLEIDKVDVKKLNLRR